MALLSSYYTPLRGYIVARYLQRHVQPVFLLTPRSYTRSRIFWMGRRTTRKRELAVLISGKVNTESAIEFLGYPSGLPKGFSPEWCGILSARDRSISTETHVCDSEISHERTIIRTTYHCLESESRASSLMPTAAAQAVDHLFFIVTENFTGRGFFSRVQNCLLLSCKRNECLFCAKNMNRVLPNGLLSMKGGRIVLSDARVISQRCILTPAGAP